MARSRSRRAYTLLELVAVLAVVSLAAGLVLVRMPGASAVRLEEAGMRLAERLSVARERAIVLGQPVQIDPADELPHAVRLESLDVGGTASPHGLELAPDGDPLPVRAVLADDTGTRLEVVLPPGFHRARVLRP
jgi:prepilin-type N-terminal cleavage/methylation domain-containing protein